MQTSASGKWAKWANEHNKKNSAYVLPDIAENSPGNHTLRDRMPEGKQKRSQHIASERESQVGDVGIEPTTPSV